MPLQGRSMHLAGYGVCNLNVAYTSALHSSFHNAVSVAIAGVVNTMRPQSRNDIGTQMLLLHTEPVCEFFSDDSGLRFTYQPQRRSLRLVQLLQWHWRFRVAENHAEIKIGKPAVFGKLEAFFFASYGRSRDSVPMGQIDSRLYFQLSTDF